MDFELLPGGSSKFIPFHCIANTTTKLSNANQLDGYITCMHACQYYSEDQDNKEHPTGTFLHEHNPLTPNTCTRKVVVTPFMLGY